MPEPKFDPPSFEFEREFEPLKPTTPPTFANGNSELPPRPTMQPETINNPPPIPDDRTVQVEAPLITNDAVMAWLHSRAIHGDVMPGHIISLLDLLHHVNERMYDAILSYRPPQWVIDHCVADPKSKGAELLQSLEKQFQAITGEDSAHQFEFPNLRGRRPNF